MRWMPRSLQGRMLALSAVATLVALALAGWAIAGVLERFVTEGLDRRLDAEIALLASAVNADGSIDRDRLGTKNGAFEQGPGWQWRIDAPKGRLGSADFPILEPGPPIHVHGERSRPGPDSGTSRIRPYEGREADGARVHARSLTLRTKGGAVTIVAAAPRAVVSRPIRAALLPLLAALAVLGALLTLATLLQLRLGLRPVRRIRDQLAALRDGRRATIDEDQPSELRPLAIELNALARDNMSALATARQSAANLAHALKTPVATLALDLRGEPARAAQVARIEATIRHHLGRARSETANQRAWTPVGPAVEGVVGAVRRLHAQRSLRYEVAIDPSFAVAVDAQDLDELLGNLIDNAARFARSVVRIDAAPANGGARLLAIEISDDGPGIPAAERDHVPRPGLRLDERGQGHGFGLSIVEELARLYGGSLELREAPGGGLFARTLLPLARADALPSV